MQPFSTNDHWGDLMRASMAGDNSAYELLLRELANVLRRMVLTQLTRLGQGSGELEDIVQEILIIVHVKRGSWDPSRPFAPWINAILRYKVIDYFRHQKRHRYDNIDDVAEPALAIPAEKHESADIRSLLFKLDARQRRIVLAASVEGRSMTEIAIELGMSDGAVRVALHRALKKLAALYRRQSE